ncbi:MerR family transcriptional regulator [Isoptericola halotolerans]|uniref:DNA-binding transcriptional MerR regulator n=1 Tax=Isoptericola halotolerans TaxID=300560 RepID=A0ABX1ZYI5_9MICO|nr:MerR family transcriptional regulator [Isoptericola halotolerans]NOV95599.1 DNA-binding transcriptional MerR regulator [Isoptericola halotolerans]
MGLNHKQIGEVAERTGLSLRTIRYYEEVGLVIPSARSHGGFRLYTESDIARLMLVKRMKPLDFSLDEMRELLAGLDDLEQDGLEPDRREEILGRLAMFEAAAEERCRSLRERLESAEEFASDLRREIRSQRRAVTPR